MARLSFALKIQISQGRFFKQPSIVALPSSSARLVADASQRLQQDLQWAGIHVNEGPSQPMYVSSVLPSSGEGNHRGIGPTGSQPNHTQATPNHSGCHDTRKLPNS